MPEALIQQGYHFEIPLDFRTSIRKSNGVFFLEPSHFSRALALAILLEVSYTRSIVRLTALVGALILTFSGTGLIVLAAGSPLLLRYLDVRLLALVRGHRRADRNRLFAERLLVLHVATGRGVQHDAFERLHALHWAVRAFVRA